RDPHNAVRSDLPRAEDGVDPYELAARLWNEWLDDGVLVIDDEPSMYVDRMGFFDEVGRPHQTAVLIGALALSRPGARGHLPPGPLERVARRGRARHRRRAEHVPAPDGVLRRGRPAPPAHRRHRGAGAEPTG